MGGKERREREKEREREKVESDYSVEKLRKNRGWSVRKKSERGLMLPSLIRPNWE